MISRQSGADAPSTDPRWRPNETSVHYQRYAVAADDASQELGELALRLLELGVDVLYAPALDEAALLTRQEARRVGAVLLPASVLGSDASRLPQLFGVPAARLVPVASLEQDLAPWGACGARLGLRRPCPDSDLRFAVQAALAFDDHGEFRLDLRAPIEAVVELVEMRPGGPKRHAAMLLDVSAGGAYLATAEPLAAGTRAEMMLPAPLGGGRVEIESVFAYRPGPGSRGNRPAGMGVMFTQPDLSLRSACRSYVRSQIARFEIAAAGAGTGA